MKKLKTILQSNIFYIILIVSIFIYIIITTTIIKYNSKYDLEDNNFIGIIKEYKINGDQLSIELNTKKEDIICFYNIKTEEEQKELIEKIKYGKEIELDGSLSIPSNNTIPGNFNYKKYLYNKHIYYVLNIDNYKITKEENYLYKIKNSINDYIDKIDNTGYIKALVLGNKNNLDSDITKMYRENGVSHLFAISGMHIAIFSLLLNTLLKKVIKQENIILIIINIFLILYGLLIGYPASIKRALALTTFLTLNKLLNLNISTIKTYIISISFLIILNPFIIFDIGFQYSATTTLGIILNMNKIKGNIIKKSLLISFYANLYSLPITLYNFRNFNILSIFQNLLYVPFISYIVYPLCLISIAIKKTNIILNISINILTCMTKLLNKYLVINLIISFNIYELIIYYILLFISNFKKTFILIIIEILIVYNKPYLDSNAYIYYIDVGQGDSSLIITPHRKEVILIDTGGLVKYDTVEWKKRQTTSISDKIINLLYSKEIRKIDTLIITHGDYDHMGEAINLVKNFKVKNVIFNYDEFNELETELLKVLKDKKIEYHKELKELSVNNDKLYFLNTKKYNNENDNSNVLYFKLNNYRFLFMGDAGVNREKDILTNYNLTDIDFIKIGHHGSNTSSSKEFIDNIKPQNCLISVGTKNRYGHPKESVLGTLNDYCNIYRTDLNGSIEITINKNNYKIKTYKN